MTDPQWYREDVGERAQPGVVLAAWWKRLVALIIDNALLYVATTLVALQATSSHTVSGVRFLAELALTFLYFGYFNGVHGQTIGKRVLRIRVVDADTGLAIGLWRGLVRYLVVFLLTLAMVVPMLIDGLWPLRDPRRQSWHDKIAGSLVIDT